MKIRIPLPFTIQELSRLDGRSVIKRVFYLYKGIVSTIPFAHVLGVFVEVIRIIIELRFSGTKSDHWTAKKTSAFRQPSLFYDVLLSKFIEIIFFLMNRFKENFRWINKTFAQFCIKWVLKSVLIYEPTKMLLKWHVNRFASNTFLKVIKRFVIRSFKTAFTHEKISTPCRRWNTT